MAETPSIESTNGRSPGVKIMLERLRGMVDLSPYEPFDDAPRWMREMASIAGDDPGVLVFLSPAGVSVKGEDGRSARAMPDPTTLFLAGIVDSMRSGGNRLAIGYPPVARHLPLLLASSAVLADVMDRADDPNHTTGGVLVVSRDLDLRSRYCDVLVRAETLDSAHRGSRLKQNGERVMLRTESRRPVRGRQKQYDRQPSDGGVCFFFPRSLPDSIDFAPSLVVLDLRYGLLVRRADEILAWVAKVASSSGFAALYSLGDSDTLAALARAGFSDLPMDHAAIATCDGQVQAAATPALASETTVDTAANTSVDWSMRAAPAFLNRTHQILEVPPDDSLRVEDWLTVIGGILHQQLQRSSPDLNRARWLLSSLVHLPVPIIWYERAAYDLGRLTISRMIKVLGVRPQEESGMDTVMQNLRVAFNEVYKRLEGNHPRSVALQHLLPDIVQASDEGSVLLLLRDTTMARATRSWLSMEAFPSTPWLSRVDVHSCQEFSDIAAKRYTQAIVNGALPRRYRWIAGGALADRVAFLTFPGETDVVERQLSAFYGSDVLLAARGRRERLVCGQNIYAETSNAGDDASLHDPATDLNSADSPTHPLQLSKPVRNNRRDQTDGQMHGSNPDEPYSGNPRYAENSNIIADAVKLLDALLAGARRVAEKGLEPDIWDEDGASDEPPDSDLEGVVFNDSEAESDGVNCLRIGVESTEHGRGWIWLASDLPVECVRLSESDEMTLRLPADLQDDDVLPSMEDGDRASLFERIVKLAEGQPEMRYLEAHRRTWREALQCLADRHTIGGRIRYSTLLADLKDAGAPIDSWMTVRNWVAGDTLGPESIASIRAVGNASRTDILISDARAFDQSFRRIRGIHQGIGRRLSSAIRAAFKQVTAQGTAARSERGRDELEDRLGLPLDELLETVDFVRVVSVSNQPEIVLAHRVGRFNRH